MTGERPEQSTLSPSAGDPTQPQATEKEEKPPVEAGERVEATRAILTKLVNANLNKSKPFRRNIVENIGTADPPTGPGTMPTLHDKTVPIKTGLEGLREISVRTFVDDESDTAYHLTIGFDPKNPNDNLLLSIESPAPVGNPYGISSAAAVGITPLNRRFQDFLYKTGADVVPVHEADYTYVYDYRPSGHNVTYSATKPQVNELLHLLSQGVVIENRSYPRNGKEVKVTDITPELLDLIKS